LKNKDSENTVFYQPLTFPCSGWANQKKPLAPTVSYCKPEDVQEQAYALLAQSVATGNPVTQEALDLWVHNWKTQGWAENNPAMDSLRLAKMFVSEEERKWFGQIKDTV
jgi:hypothetical protein